MKRLECTHRADGEDDDEVPCGRQAKRTKDGPRCAHHWPKAVKARAPLKRSPMKRRRARRIDRETPREKLYKEFVHTRPCIGRRGLIGHVCKQLPVQQAHVRNLHGVTGASLKPDNFDSIPACGWLHDHIDGRGTRRESPFRVWPREVLREWLASYVREENEAFFLGVESCPF
jgi:hypothetical protein